MESKCPCPTANMKVILGTTLGGHPLTLVAMPTAVSTPEVVILLEQVKLPLAPGQGYSLSKYILPHHHKAGTYLPWGIVISSCSPSGCSPNGPPIVNSVGHQLWFTIEVVSCKLSLVRGTQKTSSGAQVKFRYTRGEENHRESHGLDILGCLGEDPVVWSSRTYPLR